MAFILEQRGETREEEAMRRDLANALLLYAYTFFLKQNEVGGLMLQKTFAQPDGSLIPMQNWYGAALRGRNGAYGPRVRDVLQREIHYVVDIGSGEAKRYRGCRGRYDVQPEAVVRYERADLDALFKGEDALRWGPGPRVRNGAPRTGPIGGVSLGSRSVERDRGRYLRLLYRVVSQTKTENGRPRGAEGSVRGRGAAEHVERGPGGGWWAGTDGLP